MPDPGEKQSVPDVLDALDGPGDRYEITADISTIEKALDVWIESDGDRAPPTRGS